MRTYFILFVLLFFSVHSGKAQNRNLRLELSAGIEYGRWRIDKGQLNATRIIERTSIAYSQGLQASLFYKGKRFGIGIEAKNNRFFENMMHNHSSLNDKGYQIARNNSIDFYQFYLAGEFDLINGRIYELTPALAGGLFLHNARFPNRDEFFGQSVYKLSINNRIKFGRVSLSISPVYSLMRMSSEPAYLGRLPRHKIAHLGLNAGLALML